MIELARILVDFGLETRFQRLVGITGTQEIGVADEKTLFVVVGVDEPAGDTLGAVGSDIAGLGMEYINPVDLDPDPPILGLQDVDIGLPEDDEQVTLSSVLQVVRHVQVGVHAGLENGDLAKLAELGGMGFVVERTCNQHIEASIPGFPRRLNGRQQQRNQDPNDGNHDKKFDELRAAAAELRLALQGYNGVMDVNDSFRAGKQEVQLALLPEALTLHKEAA